MKQPYTLFRVAAVVSAIVLVTGFVLLKGGSDLFPGSKSGRIVPATPEPSTQSTPATSSLTKEFELAAGSKAGMILESGDFASQDDAPATQPSSQPASLTSQFQQMDRAEFEKRKALIHSSKSMTPLFEPSTQPALENDASTIKP